MWKTEYDLLDGGKNRAKRARMITSYFPMTMNRQHAE